MTRALSAVLGGGKEGLKDNKVLQPEEVEARQIIPVHPLRQAQKLKGL
jgi:hypothetical protein